MNSQIGKNPASLVWSILLGPFGDGIPRVAEGCGVLWPFPR